MVHPTLLLFSLTCGPHPTPPHETRCSPFPRPPESRGSPRSPPHRFSTLLPPSPHPVARIPRRLLPSLLRPRLLPSLIRRSALAYSSPPRAAASSSPRFFAPPPPRPTASSLRRRLLSRSSAPPPPLRGVGRRRRRRRRSGGGGGGGARAERSGGKLLRRLLLLGALAASCSYYLLVLQAQASVPPRYDGFAYGGGGAAAWKDAVLVEAFLDPLCPDSHDAWQPLKLVVQRYSPRASLIVHPFPLPEFMILNLLEFNSKRKRMSVILKDEYGQILLLCKGANNSLFQPSSIIFDRLAKSGSLFEPDISNHLNEYGDAGLWTLALTYRVLEGSECSSWNADFLKAETSIEPNKRIATRASLRFD